MKTVTAEQTVGELVAERIDRSNILEGFGIDYCCDGDRPLSAACDSMGLTVEDVLTELNAADLAHRSGGEVDFNSMKLDELILHILSTHHAYLSRELPKLVGLAQKVADAHMDHDPRVRDLESVVRGLEEELTSHMGKEERILFPMIRQMVQTESLPAMSFCGSLANPIAAMESEHDGAGDALRQMRELTENYAIPDWSCNTHRALMKGLRILESDLHHHIHKENNILFPKALAMEKELRAKV